MTNILLLTLFALMTVCGLGLIVGALLFVPAGEFAATLVLSGLVLAFFSALPLALAEYTR